MMERGNDRSPIAAAILYVTVGPLIWAGHLFLVYGPQSALCAFHAVDPPLVSAFVGLVTVLAAGALGLTVWLPDATARLFRAAPLLEGENGRFALSLVRILAALSLVGVLWAGAGALLLNPCGQLR